VKLKKCKKCGKEKAPEMFYDHYQTKDGRMGKCKECARSDAIKNRNANIDRVRAYDRKRGKLPHRIKANIERSKKRWKDNPYIGQSHSKVRQAIKSGILVRPEKCSCCGNKARVVGHHHDYSKPLDVAWLCHPCHRQLHRDLF